MNAVSKGGRTKNKTGRNDPCHCGSGKKYKLCHGRSHRESEVTPERQRKLIDDIMSAHNVSLSRRNSAPSEDSIYQDRYVVFLEILEFKETLYASLKDGRLLESVRHALEEDIGSKYINFLKREILAHNEHIPDPDIRLTSFSSFIVVSTNSAIPQTALFIYLFHMIAESMPQGIFFRGSCTRGLLHQRDNVVFGPGLVQAYQMTKQVKCLPRIVVDSGVFSSTFQNRPMLIAPGPNHRSRAATCIPVKFDESDGCLILNVIGFALARAVWEERYDIDCQRTGEKNIQRLPRYWRDWPNQFSRHVTERLLGYRNHADLLGRYIWLAEYFNADYFPLDLDINTDAHGSNYATKIEIT